MVMDRIYKNTIYTDIDKIYDEYIKIRNSLTYPNELYTKEQVSQLLNREYSPLEKENGCSVAIGDSGDTDAFLVVLFYDE